MEISTRNFWPYRQDPETRVRYTPRALVLHITDGTFNSTVNHFQNPNSQVSSHWIVDRDGEWHKVVDEKHASWTNGLVVNPTWQGITPTNPNLYTISVEVVNQGELPSWRQWASWARGCRDILKRYNWPVDDIHIVNHYEINGRKRCPGIWFSRFYLKLLLKFV